MTYLTYSSPIGILTVFSDGVGIAGILPEIRHYPFPAAETAVFASDDPLLIAAADWLDRYFAGERPAPGELPLSVQGSEFQQTVWKMLCEIPYGECVTYGGLSREYCRRTGAERMSAQAIGGAVGRNPVCIAVPCHRVIGADGSLTGYAGGLERKRWLLELEQATACKGSVQSPTFGSRAD